jgi:hypothetical protein
MEAALGLLRTMRVRPDATTDTQRAACGNDYNRSELLLSYFMKIPDFIYER